MHEYDAVGNVVATIDPGGHRTDYIRNQLNQVVRVLAPTLSTPSGNVRFATDTIYDANDNVTEIRVPNVDDQGVTQANAQFTTAYQYDILNRPTRVTREVDAASTVTEEYQYDANRNLTLVRSGEAVAGGATGSQTGTSHDERDLVLDVTGGAGGAV